LIPGQKCDRPGVEYQAFGKIADFSERPRTFETLDALKLGRE
jgi:hypothetical protein